MTAVHQRVTFKSTTASGPDADLIGTGYISEDQLRVPDTISLGLWRVESDSYLGAMLAAAK